MRALRNKRSTLGLIAITVGFSLSVGQSATYAQSHPVLSSQSLQFASVKAAANAASTDSSPVQIAATALAQNEKSAPVPSAATATSPAAAPVNLNSAALTAKGQTYKLSPDDTTWKDFLETFRIYLSDGRTLKAPASAVIQQNKALRDVQARAIEAGGARVWTFPGSQNNHALVIQSGGGVSAEGAPAAKAVIVPLPETVNVTAAKIVKSFTTKTESIKVRRKVIQRTVRVEGPSMLVVAGLDRVSGLVYLGAYRPVGNSWSATTEPFSQISQNFMQTLSGQASFNGNDLVLSVSSQSPADSQPEAKTDTKTGSQLPKPKSSSYQIVLKFVGGHFVVAGAPGKDVPLQVVTYFVQCMRTGRMDLAKAWLADPSLVSIPKYIGLVGRNQEPYKLISMSNPAGGGTRYRLVTNQKHDLIFDCGKVKKDIMIKAMFIAPPDPLTKNLMGTLIGAPPPPPPAAADGTPSATTPVAPPAKSN